MLTPLRALVAQHVPLTVRARDVPKGQPPLLRRTQDSVLVSSTNVTPFGSLDHSVDSWLHPSLIYSVGSLYTSILPCLALRAVGPAILHSPSLRAKVLFLNSTHDRETPGYSALDFVEAVRSACAWRYEDGAGVDDEAQVAAREVVSHVVYVEGAEVECEVEQLQALGIACVACEEAADGTAQFDEDLVRRALGVILGN